jgi:hypothetical protein
MLKFGGNCMAIQPARTGVEMAIYPLRIDKFIYPPHEQTTANCCNKPHIIDEEKKERKREWKSAIQNNKHIGLRWVFLIEGALLL